MKLAEDEVSWTNSDDGGVIILHLASSKYFSLNGSGARLWELLAAGDAERDDLVAKLVATYNLDMSRAEADVDAFVVRLSALNLLRDQSS